MDFFIEAVFSVLRLIILDLTIFGIGFTILYLVSFGTSPNTEILEIERKEYGELTLLLFVMEAPEHRLVYMAGFITMIFSVLIACLMLFI